MPNNKDLELTEANLHQKNLEYINENRYFLLLEGIVSVQDVVEVDKLLDYSASE